MNTANIEKSIKQKDAAKKIIHRRMLYAAGLGLIPIPIVDAAGILGIQILMIKDIAKVYEIPFKEHRVRSFIGSLAGSLGAMSAVKALPGMGSVIGAAAISTSGAASTYAIGKVFIHHFNLGGTLLNFDPIKSQEYFYKVYKEGEKEAALLKAKKTGKIGTFVKKMVSSKKGTVSNVSANSSRKRNNLAIKEKRAKELAKAKRQKKIIAKRKRKARNKKIKRYALLLFLVGITAYFLYQKTIKNSKESTSLDLSLEKIKVRQVDLQPIDDLDSLTIAKIAQFSSNTTEGAIIKHIQKSEATYPKRFALSAVRFNGNSNALSSGAQNQLSNIAFLMKKYPALIVNIYGHTSNIGPEFNRRRIGRERARLLKSIFVDIGIPSYRITGNYIEKPTDIHDEYWGAEIVIDISTEENAVNVKVPSLSSSKDFVPGFIKEIVKKKKETPKEEFGKTSTEKLEEKPTDTSEWKPLISFDSSKKVTSTEVGEVDTTSSIETKEKLLIDSIKSTEDTRQKAAESTNLEQPKIVSSSRIQFSGRSDEVAKKAKKQLTAITQLLQENTDLKVEVYGYVLSGSSPKIGKPNKEKVMLEWENIGKDRAGSIKKELNDNGISNDRIIVSTRKLDKAPSEFQWGAEVVIVNKE